MIEVTQKDRKGRIQTIEVYDTDEEFGFIYRWRQSQATLDTFATEHKMVGSHDEYINEGSLAIRCIPDFTRVAYNGKGKVLDPSYLVGLVRADRHGSYRYHHAGFRNSWGNLHPHERYRQLHTTPERRATFACNDQEGHVPKIRGRRTMNHLPHSWSWWDETPRDNRNCNWKKFRKTQWKPNNAL